MSKSFFSKFKKAFKGKKQSRITPNSEDELSIHQHYSKFKEDAFGDLYMDWLLTMVGGWLPPKHPNLVSILYGIEKTQNINGSILEVGSFLGASTCVISYLANKFSPNKVLFNCDPWKFEGADKPIGGVFDASKDEFALYAKDLFLRNTGIFGFNNKISSHHMLSSEFFIKWQRRETCFDLQKNKLELGGVISFAYIDGNHTYEGCLEDFLNLKKFLVPGSMVLFDDTGHDSPFGCRNVVQDVLKHGLKEVWHNPNYLFTVV